MAGIKPECFKIDGIDLAASVDDITITKKDFDLFTDSDSELLVTFIQDFGPERYDFKVVKKLAEDAYETVCTKAVGFDFEKDHSYTVSFSWE